MIDQKKPQEPIISNPVTNVQEIIRKGNEIYESNKAGFEPINNGKYVVIEVDSGEYFIGNTRDEASMLARKKFTDERIMFVRRIGPPEKISRHAAYSYSKYARIF